MIDAYLDGNVTALQRWRMTRHLEACAECRGRREACEADRAFLAEVRQSVASHEAYVRALPETLVVAPSLSTRVPLQRN
jgi:anti-sigma factor RsiW